MTMSNNCEALDTSNISPVRAKVKHTSTPLRTRRKTSRRDQGLDVHTVLSHSSPTPHRSPRLQRLRQDSPKLLNSGLNSPSSSFPCSQDSRPDVVWDFTSPKLVTGSKKRELKITVQELLDNLNQCQAVECDSKSNRYIELLENWMSKQPTELPVKEIKNQKKDAKNRSRHRVEKLKKFIESIQKSKNEKTPPHSKSPLAENRKADDSPKLKQNTCFKNSFLEGGKSDDSSEELWGDADNSFIIKATQEVDKLNSIPTATHVEEIISTIPETAPNPSSLKNNSETIESGTQSCEEHADVLLHLSSIDWDGDDDEWDNGFLLEDDDLSLVPDNLLSGETNEKEAESINHRDSSVNMKRPAAVESRNIPVVKTITEKDSLLEETEFIANCPINELYNSFEDENFEEESLLCQPEVLSRLDEVENMLSQPKCTPDEIKKKKDEALKRRKKTQLRRKN